VSAAPRGVPRTAGALLWSREGTSIRDLKSQNPMRSKDSGGLGISGPRRGLPVTELIGSVPGLEIFPVSDLITRSVPGVSAASPVVSAHSLPNEKTMSGSQLANSRPDQPTDTARESSAADWEMRLGRSAEHCENLKAERDLELIRRDRLILAAIDRGWSRSLVAKLARVSPTRVTQVIARDAAED
jgi:hypothetical protein